MQCMRLSPIKMQNLKHRVRHSEPEAVDEEDDGGEEVEHEAVDGPLRGGRRAVLGQGRGSNRRHLVTRSRLSRKDFRIF